MARTYVSLALAAIVSACSTHGVTLEEDHRSGPGWRKDFRLTAGFDDLPKNDTYEDKVESLNALLAQEMAKKPICRNGYEVTKHGAYEGFGYWWVEGICK